MTLTPSDILEKYGMESVSTQIGVFAVSFLAGMVMIAIYTGYSWLLVKLFPKRNFKRTMSFISADFHFWSSAATAMFFLYYRLNNAVIRPYCFIFILCGMITAYNLKLLIIKKKHLPYRCSECKKEETVP